MLQYTTVHYLSYYIREIYLFATINFYFFFIFFALSISFSLYFACLHYCTLIYFLLLFISFPFMPSLPSLPNNAIPLLNLM